VLRFVPVFIISFCTHAVVAQGQESRTRRGGGVGLSVGKKTIGSSETSDSIAGSNGSASVARGYDGGLMNMDIVPQRHRMMSSHRFESRTYILKRVSFTGFILLMHR
jgi:hypothetical protein